MYVILDWLRLGVLLPDCWVSEDVITEEFVTIFSVCCLMKVSNPDIRTRIVIIFAVLISNCSTRSLQKRGLVPICNFNGTHLVIYS